MIIVGNHNDRNGNNIERVVRPTSARRKGTTPRLTVCTRNPGVLAMITNRFVPTGGVINPTSTRSTDFITPKSPVSKAFRDAVRDLAEDDPFARRLFNGGRLSTPATYVDTVGIAAAGDRAIGCHGGNT